MKKVGGNTCDSAGISIGLFRVLGVSSEKVRGKKSWDLLCSCGNIVVKNTSDVSKLVSTSNCGCVGRKRVSRALSQGDQFGCYTVVCEEYTSKDFKVYWRCRCSCGSIYVKSTSALRSGVNKYCKTCVPKVTETGSYRSWSAAQQRCYNPLHTHYSYYGGAGISMSPDWDDFRNFHQDMGERPEGFVLDRIDPFGNYCKENCRWVDRSESSYNTRMQRNNQSGKTGVRMDARDGRYYAVIDCKGDSIYLGSSMIFEDAVRMREEAEIEYFGYNKD